MATNSAPPRPRLWARIAAYAVLALVGAYLVLALATWAPGVLTLIVVAGVLALDGVLIVVVARRRTVPTAIWCGVVALLAAVVQSVWVWTIFTWTALPSFGDGWGWWCCGLVVALLLAAGLLVRKASRPFGWAVLLGSVQGGVAALATLVALLAIALAGD